VHSVQDVRLDPLTRKVWRGDSEIVFSRKEFDLLHALISRAGEIVSRDALMRDVWDTTFWTSSKTIDVHLGWVRRKLGDDSRRPSLITTIRGKGLRFETSSPGVPTTNATLAPAHANGHNAVHGARAGAAHGKKHASAMTTKAG
jgi:DNA-binding winged helix-turn-helix (wHTH) protein